MSAPSDASAGSMEPILSDVVWTVNDVVEKQVASSNAKGDCVTVEFVTALGDATQIQSRCDLPGSVLARIVRWVVAATTVLAVAVATLVERLDSTAASATDFDTSRIWRARRCARSLSSDMSDGKRCCSSIQA